MLITNTKLLEDAQNKLEGEMIKLKCEVCGTEFDFFKEKRREQLKNGWINPKTCSKECTDILRESLYSDPRYDGWMCTMKPNFQKKQRHSRAPYSAFMIGGCF